MSRVSQERTKGNEFPLVVKLGTITPNGADVYSYAPDEDEMVKDPLLAKHLEHWGAARQVQYYSLPHSEPNHGHNNGSDFCPRGLPST